MIALVDVTGRRLFNSPAYERILGYTPTELGETSSFEQIHPDDRFRILEAAREARETGVGKRLEYRIKHKDGSWRVLESVASAIRDDKGEVAKLVIVNRDITERKRAEAQLEHNLFHDPLTGLPNRRQFLDRLQNSFVQTRRDAGRPHTLLLANVDHFKGFNETMGTAAGDQILTEVGRRLAAHLRQDDTITRRENAGDVALFRLGGDEFTILLDALRDPSDAMRVAHRMQARVADPFMVDSHEVRVALSIGIALSTPIHERSEDLLRDADAAGLRQFPVDALKIDRSLVREMQADRSAADIVELIAALAHKMNLRAIAEGVESARPVERLLALGCEYGQGHYFSQPMEAKAAEQFMLEQIAQTRARGAGK
jgi:diguanylate cyclase (GGDEF)-like protein/PAS domain S-box-containing protein